MPLILPQVKLGTMPYGPARVKRVKSVKVGDVIEIRHAYSKKNIHSNPWKKVRVDLIKEDIECYFVSGASCG